MESLLSAMSSCHALHEIDGKRIGDDIDFAMFEATQSKLCNE